jgi:hypothetical protein
MSNRPKAVEDLEEVPVTLSSVECDESMEALLQTLNSEIPYRYGIGVQKALQILHGAKMRARGQSVS